MKWQPIESAPKDTRVIAAWFGSKAHTETAPAFFYPDENFWCNPEDLRDRYGIPDMWMPWPDDPEHPGEEFIDNKFLGGME